MKKIYLGLILIPLLMAVSGGRSLTGGAKDRAHNFLDYWRGGCSTTIGCASPTGGAWLLDPGIFDYTFPSRSLGAADNSYTCSPVQNIFAWNGASNRIACNKGFDYAIMWHGVNDFLANTSVGPSTLAQRVIDANRTFLSAGVTPIWIAEPPINGNTTSAFPACATDSATGLNCATFVEQFNRILNYGGNWN